MRVTLPTFGMLCTALCYRSSLRIGGTSTVSMVDGAAAKVGGASHQPVAFPPPPLLIGHGARQPPSLGGLWRMARPRPPPDGSGGRVSRLEGHLQLLQQYRCPSRSGKATILVRLRARCGRPYLRSASPPPYRVRDLAWRRAAGALAGPSTAAPSSQARGLRVHGPKGQS